MRKYQTRANRGAIPFEVDGVQFMAKPVLEMQARRDLSTMVFEIESSFEAVRKTAATKAKSLKAGDKEGFAKLQDEIETAETGIRATVLEACALCIVEQDQERFVKAAEEWDDFTLYQIFSDLQAQATTADERMLKERPTSP